ncbi:M15 family metallopeptidase [Aquirufa sp. ROCK2-A2]
MKKRFSIFLIPIVLLLFLSGFIWTKDNPVSPIRRCKQINIDSISLEDLLWIYQQQDTLADYAVNQSLTLGWKSKDGTTTFKRFGQDHRSLDSLNKVELYALRLIHQHSEIASFWKQTLSSELDSFSIKKDTLLDKFHPKPYRLKFVSESRSLAKQIELHKKGKSKIMLSLHNFGLAADVGIYRHRKYVRRGNTYNRMGASAKELGLFWGGDFVGFPDPGHIQAFPNSASLVAKYPILGFEFEKYEGQYENTFQKQSALGKEYLVEDTKALLTQLNNIRLNQNCACSKAIMPSNDDEIVNLLKQFLSQNQAVVFANLKENWVYVQKGQSGYVYSLGKWTLE